MLCTIKASERPRSSNSITHIFNHAPPAPHGEGKKKEGVWRGMMVRLYILLLPSYTKREREREKKKEKSVESLLFLTQKGAEECLKFREGWRVWNLSPRGQTGGFFSFQALIDSPLSSLATQKDTWKNFWWGCDVRNRVTCSADALSWFLTSTSALSLSLSVSLPPWASVQLDIFNFFLLLQTGEDFKTLRIGISAHPSIKRRDDRLPGESATTHTQTW